jgi:hypothetical protein
MKNSKNMGLSWGVVVFGREKELGRKWGPLTAGGRGQG